MNNWVSRKLLQKKLVLVRVRSIMTYLPGKSNKSKHCIEENLVQSDRSIEVAAKRWRASINQSIVNHSPALLFLPAIDTLLTQNKLKYNHKCRLKILLCESWIAITWMLQIWFICIYSKETNSFFLCQAVPSTRTQRGFGR